MARRVPNRHARLRRSYHCRRPLRRKKPITTTTTALPARTIASLAAGYALRRPEEIAGFLETYPFLVALLLEARPVIARHFGAETPVVLEVSYDPEDDDLTELVAWVQTKRPWAEARAQEKRFGDEWWLTNVHRADCRLAIFPAFPEGSTP